LGALGANRSIGTFLLSCPARLPGVLWLRDALRPAVSRLGATMRIPRVTLLCGTVLADGAVRCCVGLRLASPERCLAAMAGMTIARSGLLSLGARFGTMERSRTVRLGTKKTHCELELADEALALRSVPPAANGGAQLEPELGATLLTRSSAWPTRVPGQCSGRGVRARETSSWCADA